ncbi:bifunctional DNA primase/polymerase [Paenibacillus camerounensis]|uniref:bifunctional DNA primase/polymerase n=1 Tax=Paenibacillus camerounensis TaxID=1243663 RepID=UPI0005A9D740|nr:bifunctional DNA primase/polymerase [Paenibacillus camerounensis]
MTIEKQADNTNPKYPLKILNEALRLGRLGMPVLPLCSHSHSGMSKNHRKSCKRPGKLTLISDWRNRATTDLEQIRNWFAKRPNWNAGLVLGKRSRVIAIDVDGEFGRAKLEELSGGDLPPTWRYSTPGGGYRYLYLTPYDAVFKKASFSSADDEHEALELLGDGQYTVIPGSVHANGGVYEWEEGGSPDDLPLAPAPEWMLREMNTSWAAAGLFDDEAQEDEADPSQENAQEAFSENVDLSQPLTGKLAPSASFSFSSPSFSPAGLISQAPTLERLAKGCPCLLQITGEQADGGCSEDAWFKTTSLLTRLGKQEEARFFSEASEKHDAHSESRLEKMEADARAEAFGHPRCSAFGCSTDQVKACFGSVRLKDGQMSNSPADWVRSKKPKPALPEHIDKRLAEGQYQIKDGKVGESTYAKKGEETFHPIANFVAYASATVLADDGAEARQFFTIEGVSLDTWRPLPPLEVKMEEFESLNWIFRWGLSANLEPEFAAKAKMRHLIQLLSKDALKKTVYAHLGFRRFPEGWRYLHGGGCVGEENVEVKLDKRLEKYVLPEPGASLEQPIRASLNLLNVAKPEVTLPLLSAVFLSPLCEALRQVGIEPAFLLWLYGVTGTRKSTLSALFLSHFGQFSPKGPPASFKDTANSLEKRAFDCKDCLLWIDDFHPSASSGEARKMEQIAQFLIRSYGDRVGRGRMKTDASLRADYAAKGIALVTGEQQIDGHSSSARVQGVELRPSDIDLVRLSEAQRQSDLLASTMTGYVAWVGEQMSKPGFAEGLRQTFRERRDLALPGQSHGRLAENAAWLFLGWDNLLKFAALEGVLTESERQLRLDEGWTTLLSLSEEQSEQVLGARPGEQFLSIVGELLQNGSLYTLPANVAERKSCEDLAPKGKHVGWQDNERFYFLPSVLYNEVSTFLSKQQEQIPLKMKDLWRQLHFDGLLEPEITRDHGKEKVKFTRRKAIDGQRVNTVWIKRSAVWESDPESEARENVRKAAAAQKPRPVSDWFET